MIADDFARQSRSVVIALAAYRISRSEIIALAVHRSSQAHPGGFRQVYDRRMHELPHALPLRQILQQAFALGWTVAGAGSRSDAISGSRFPRRHSHGGMNRPAHKPLPTARAASSSSTPRFRFENQVGERDHGADAHPAPEPPPADNRNAVRRRSGDPSIGRLRSGDRPAARAVFPFASAVRPVLGCTNREPIILLQGEQDATATPRQSDKPIRSDPAP